MLPFHCQWNHEDRSEGDPNYDKDEPEVPCLQLFETVDNNHSAGQISAITKMRMHLLISSQRPNAHHDLLSDSKQNHMGNLLIKGDNRDCAGIQSL